MNVKELLIYIGFKKVNNSFTIEHNSFNCIIIPDEMSDGSFIVYCPQGQILSEDKLIKFLNVEFKDML